MTPVERPPSTLALPAWLTRFLALPFVRFIVMGGVNTVITYGAYLLLLLVMPYEWAYTLTYVAGIFLAYWMNARFVFHAPIRWRSALQFPLVYLAQYALGLGLTVLFVEQLRLPAEIAPALVQFLSIPVSFLLTKWIMRGKASA